MAASYWGADVGELRTLAKDFDQKAAQLTTLMSTLTSTINGTSAWKGPDADTFRQEWNSGHRQSLSNATTILRTASTALVKNADDQEHASTDGGAFGGGSGPGGPGGSGSDDGSGGDVPTIPGGTDEENDLLLDILNDPALLMSEDFFDGAAVVDLMNTLSQLRLAGQFSTLEGAVGFSRFANGFNTLNDFLGGQNWGSLTQGLSNVVTDSAWAGRIGSAAEFLGSAGKVLGPVGAVLGVVTVVSDVVEGDYVRAAYDGVATGLGIAAMVTPPPANVALGIAAGGMALGGLLYDNVPVFHDAVDATGEFIGDAAGAIGDAASDFAGGVADVAEDLWPF